MYNMIPADINTTHTTQVVFWGGRKLPSKGEGTKITSEIFVRVCYGRIMLTIMRLLNVIEEQLVSAEVPDKAADELLRWFPAAFRFLFFCRLYSNGWTIGCSFHTELNSWPKGLVLNLATTDLTLTSEYLPLDSSNDRFGSSNTPLLTGCKTGCCNASCG